MAAHPQPLLSLVKNNTRPVRVMALGLRGFPGVQGGVEAHAEHLYPQLVKLGCRVEIIGRAPYLPDAVGNEWRGVTLRRLWAPRVKGLEALLHTFIGVLYAATRRPDVLHIHAVGPALMTPLARALGLRVVVTHHGADYHRQKWGRVARRLLRTGERWGMRFAHQRIAISRVIHNLVRTEYARDAVLIHNGVDLPELTQSDVTLQKFALARRRYVLLVSRLVPEKRHLDLIQAFATAHLDGWKLVLVGAADHPDDYTRYVTAAASATPGVICAGFQSGAALSELYAHAGIFVLPSSHEGLPIALLEALSFGVPVLASDIPPNREIGLGAECYFPLGDIHALAAALRR
ncbi:MAG: glycosyltransferase family 4 protein, partial [Pseudomonadota bacterium]